MLSAVEQIKAGFEVSNMTPQEIAEDLDMDEGAVKAALIQSSAAYRKQCGMESQSEDQSNFTEEQLRVINNNIYRIALEAEHPDGSEDYKTKLAASMYIRDDKKGRKEVNKMVQNGNTFNILQLNAQFREARVAAQKAINGVRQKQLIEA